LAGNRYEGVDNVEDGTCGNQVLKAYLVPTLAVQSEYFMVGQGGTVEAAREKGWKHV
jgi:hypothetical protein